MGSLALRYRHRLTSLVLSTVVVVFLLHWVFGPPPSSYSNALAGVGSSLHRTPPASRDDFGCDRCLVDREICDKFGTHNIDLSRAFDGTGARVQRVLKRAMAGEPITMGALGGSISRAHGCPCKSWQFRVFDWWNQTFPHPDNKLIDGSVGARGSDYFKFCHRQHLPADEVDIVVMEMAVNDPMDPASFVNFETLLRGILSYPKKPAVVVLQTMQIQGPSNGGGDMHLSTCGYYDVPAINVRNWLLPKFMANYTSAQDWFNWNIEHNGKLIKAEGDKLHPKDAGHGIMAELINIYLAQQVCFVRNARPVVPPSSHFLVTQDSERDIDILPRVRLNQHLLADNTEHDAIPSCASIDSDKSPLVPVADQTKGWEIWTKSVHLAKKFLRATEVGSVVTFEVETGFGEINAYFLRSKTMGLGTVECWLDNDKNKRDKIDGYWERPENVGQFQRLFKNQKIPAGKHLVHCEVTNASANPNKEDRTTFLFIGMFSV